MLENSNEILVKLIKDNIETKKNYEQLYKQNRGFIYKTIKNRVNAVHDIDDLMQQSFIALLNAVNYYNCDLERKSFLSILKYCILNELRDLIVELPAHMQNKIINYKKAYNKLYNRLGYKPKTYQIMLEMNLSLKQLDIIRSSMRQTLSLDEPVGEDGDTTRLELYADSSVDECIDFDNGLEQQDINKAIKEAIGKLPEKSQELIDNRYFKNWTLNKCSKEMNISKERVRQIEYKVFRKLRHDKEFERKLDEYINIYKTVGVNSFNRTNTSSTELLVLEREKIRQNCTSSLDWLTLWD